MTNKIKVNNYGFVSNIDYDPALKTPLMAIIGDSYIEAVMIPWDQTGAARLQRRLGSGFRVYSFGASGAPLSQYLAYAEYVGREFSPAGLVIVIIGNDFDESLLKYKNAPGFHYFAETDDGALALQRVDYRIGIWQRLVRRSRVFMYLATNVNLAQSYYNILYALRKDTFAGNTSTSADPERVSDSKRAVDTFLAMLPRRSRLGPCRVLFVLDGIRPQLYDKLALEGVRGSYYDVMRRYFIAQARDRRFEVIDMQPLFQEHYEKHGRRFEFPIDGHWNDLGHELLADAVAKSQLFSSLTGAQQKLQ